MKKLFLIIISCIYLYGCFSEPILNTETQEKETRAISSDFTNLRVFINPGGIYTKPVQAYLTCTSTKGWLAKWTVDGSEPTWTNGGWSYDPIIIKKTCTFKWRVFDLKNHSNYSYVAEANYIINDNIYTPTTFKYNGTEYKGKLETGTGDCINNDFSIYLDVTEPKQQKFNCDGFFIFKGKYTDIDVGKYMLLSITKIDTGEYDKYYIQGLDFNKRIWLRYGKGEYKIKLSPAPIHNYDTYWADPEYITSPQPYYTNIWYVNNTRDERGIFYYPSFNVQSDDEYIKNLATEIIAKDGSTNKDTWYKCWSLMKYVIDHFTYDYYAYFGVDCRQPQDAVTCLKTGLAVCDGYSNVYAALCRSVGIKCKSVSSSTHAWNEVLMEDGRWLIVDCLWNDIDINGIYSSTYFLRSEIEERHIKTDDRIRY